MNGVIPRGANESSTNSNPTGIAVIGWGTWGMNYVRIFNELAESRVAAVWHLHVVRTEHRDALKEHLAGQGIDVGIHYPVPIHLQPAYKDLSHKRGDFPVAEAYADRIPSLPMYAELTSGQIERVSSAISEFLAANCGGRTEAPPVASRASQIAGALIAR